MIVVATWLVGAVAAWAQANCGTATECNASAKAALDRGDLATALSAYRLQTDFATAERRATGASELLVCDGLKNLARLSLRQGAPLRGRAWAGVAEGDCAPEPDLEALSAALADEVRMLPPPPSIVGLYWDYAGYGQWNTLTVTDLGNGHFHVAWDMERYGWVRSAETDGPASTWDQEASGMLESGKLVARYPGIGSLDKDGNEYGVDAPCELHFAVQPFALVVETDLPDECTNGKWGPYPKGTFWRVEAE